MNTIEIIRRSELFVGLDNEDIQKIVNLPSCKTKAYEDQEIICEAGKEAQHLYIIDEGQVNLVLKQPSNSSQSTEPTLFRTIMRGGVFGWTALVPPHFHMGTAISKGTSRVVSISGDEIRTLFDKEPKIGYEVSNALLKIIASRVWNIERLLLIGKRSPFI
ncbi:cyclic nucleotide-binding domain-containing protein [Chloroflexota bacterium]